MRPLEVIGLAAPTHAGGNPGVILRDPRSGKTIPIWIGGLEALSIMVALQGRKPPRPLTHDMVVSLIEGFDIECVEVFIHSVDDGTFYASLQLIQDQQEVMIDVRPSDAIAVAIRLGVTISASDEVIDEAGVYLPGLPSGEPEDSDDEMEEDNDEVIADFKDFLADISPEDFEKKSD
jgi:bifunctional DNase/RNase